MQIISMAGKRITAIEVNGLHISHTSSPDNPSVFDGIGINLDAHWTEFNLRGIVQIKMSVAEANDLAKRIASFIGRVE